MLKIGGNLWPEMVVDVSVRSDQVLSKVVAQKKTEKRFSDDVIERMLDVDRTLLLNA